MVVMSGHQPEGTAMYLPDARTSAAIREHRSSQIRHANRFSAHQRLVASVRQALRRHPDSHVEARPAPLPAASEQPAG